MLKTIFKMIIYFILVILILFLFLLLLYFFVGKTTAAKHIVWGVDFSQMQAENLGLNWKETYLALIDDLGAKNIKLHTQWDFVQGDSRDYFFDDIDWQIKQAEEKGAKIIYVVGLKTGRWPECHMPKWAEKLSESQQKEEILKYIKEVVLRYKDSPAIYAWQVENEPFFKFGECPVWYYKDKEFTKEEVELVKSLDASRQIVISDSGEQSLWFEAAKTGDIVGITMYRGVWAHITNDFGFYLNSFLPAINYWRKALIINQIFGKDVICIELQAEPWTSKPYFDVPLKDQEKSMNLEQFKLNIEFAKQTGLKKFYLWGAEWWYWMKEKQNRPEIWNEAQNLFKQ